MSSNSQISIAGYSFHGLHASRALGIEGYLDLVQGRFHLPVADIWNRTLGDESDECLSASFARDVAKVLTKRGIRVVNYHFSGAWVWSEAREDRLRHAKLIERHLTFASRIGAATVRVDAGGSGDAWTGHALDYLVTAYRRYSHAGGLAGFRVGPENHWGPSLIPTNLMELVTAVDESAFGVLLHIGHWRHSSPEEADRLLAPWAMHTHIDETLSAASLSVAIESLNRARYAGYAGVEVCSGVNELDHVAARLVDLYSAFG